MAYFQPRPHCPRRASEKIDPHVEKGEIDSAKYNRKPSLPRYCTCVICVYADDRERERVWEILHSLDLLDGLIYSDYPPKPPTRPKQHPKPMDPPPSTLTRRTRGEKKMLK